MSDPRFPAKVDPVIARLHSAFVKISQRDEPARTVAHLWARLLSSEEYRGDVAALELDACFVARYLNHCIREGKKTPGFLKLKHALQEENFFSDLAEAKAVFRKRYLAMKREASVPPRPETPTVETQPATPDDAAVRNETAAGLRALREQLGGLGAAEVEKLKSANAQKQLPGS
jgi:hypothetical protein